MQRLHADADPGAELGRLMFERVLVANRGEIAARIVRTCRKLGISPIAIWSDPDRFSPPVLAADRAVRVGPAAAAQSYLDADAVLAACRETGAQAVHPGYGFLSERPEFAERLADAGIAFIGPRPAHMRAFGLKHSAREIAIAAGAPLLPGSGLLADEGEACAAAARIGYPVMLKSTAGGGGIGMGVCRDEADLRARFEGIRRMAGASFGDTRVFLEKFVAQARHVEVQIFGDGRGGVVTLGERDCSLQRRNQKVVEETPAPGLSSQTRTQLHAAAAALGREVQYASAGTVEFILDAETGAPYFLEVNTRLQVEHCVTEEVFGIDLVEWMIREATGGFALPPQESLAAQGSAIEARIYAENPAADFRPSTGVLTEVRFAAGVRCDTWVERGVEVSPFYDPLLAKIVAHDATRDGAIGRLRAALAGSAISGIETNIDYVAAVLGTEEFAQAAMTTGTLARFAWQPRNVEVLAPGTQSSLQDWPGRLGWWGVGVPPSGPMDDRSFRMANRILGNEEGTTALEMTLAGPVLRFNAPATAALAGARMHATLDGAPMAFFEPFEIPAGGTLALGTIEGPGARCYLAVRGGFDAPEILGARATFALGGFGGHATGTLRTGDTLRLAPDHGREATPIAASERPDLAARLSLGVLVGPHAAPDFFTRADMAELFNSDYEVHYNSARTGVRLIGPKPTWARESGGEAGLHPSNIHDNAYAIGAIDFTGDTPIILGPDGPSLGGFVCPAVVVAEERWKLGQLRPGDRLRFRRLDPPALALPATLVPPAPDDEAVLARRDGEIPVCYRRAGDRYVLVEFGPPVLDLELRLHVQLFYEAIRDARLPGIIDLTPGIRSLQVHHDPAVIGTASLLDALDGMERAIARGAADATVTSRIVYLPLAWSDSQTTLAMRRYQELVRPDAPWCPSNIEFIRRINGLPDEAAVRRVVFDASYLVLGLGDVYLGAPVATPIDPRHRLVTTKYNPARPWTPENAVGIGGAYMCIYGMEGPGGYQLFGRTLPVWNRWRRTEAFTENTLLRLFDQIRFVPVSEEELLDARAAFPHGRTSIRIEESSFSAPAYRDFLARNAAEIGEARRTREAAFEAERQRWVAQGFESFVADDPASDPFAGAALPAGSVAVDSPVPGNVWKIVKEAGDAVAAGETIVIVESMKMEMRVVAPVAGRVAEILCKPGREVRGGQRVAVIRAGEAR